MKYNSGRVKKFEQTGITSDRYQFLGLEQAEPDLGDPIVGVSSVSANPVPEGDQYVLIAVDGQVGKRYWVKSTEQTGAGIQGSQGVQGPLSDFQGTQGSQGTQGFQGLQGRQGAQGMIGNFQGTQGAQGLSIQGTQGVQSTQGTQGTQGIQSTQGTQGRQGSQGVQGSKGIQGVQGVISNFQGTQGLQGSGGIQGSQGTQGTQASQGTQGTQGIQSTQGTQGRQGSQGVQGTQGIEGEGTQGAQGIQGIQGPLSDFQGTQGLFGTDGNQGSQGIQGPLSDFQGTQGLQGESLQGSTGTAGSIGPQGAQGLQGLQGTSIQGSTGDAGQTGSQGVQGTQGLQGSQGSQGLQGREGSGGTQGAQGSQGLQGSQGSQGAQGRAGSGGSQGAQGLQGLQGLSGSGGNQGAQGTQGRQGVQGFGGLTGGQGAQGTQGIQGGGSQGTQGFAPSGGTTSFAVMDFSVASSIEVGSGAKLATPSGSDYNPGSSTQVPATSNIGVFYYRPTRTLKTVSKVYLSTVSYLYFYVRKDFYGATDYDAYLQYSYDGSNWTTFSDGSLIHDAQDMPYNIWTLRTIEIEAAAKYYGGVYLRFYQASFGSSFGDDVWAFSSVVASTGSPVSGSQVGSENLNIAVMDFSAIDNFDLGNGARIINPGVTYGPGSSSVVPSYASIGSLDGVRVDRFGSRIISTKNRVYLSTIDYLYFYVIKDFYETTDYDLYFQYSLDNSTWTTMDTILHDGDATVGYNAWSQRRVLVPSGAKNYGGVYLRFYQQSFSGSIGYDSWAFSSVMASFSAASSSGSVYDGNIQLSVMNFNNPDTLTISSGARIATPSGGSGNPSSTSIVPSYTNIGCLDGNIFASPPAVSRFGSRELKNKNRVYLSTVDYLYFYVIKDFYETTDYDLYFQYSLDGSTWTNIDTILHDGDATVGYNAWSQRRVLVPSGAKNYGGVYLRFYQQSFNNSSGYDGWAVSPVMIYFSSASSSSTSYDGNMRNVVFHFDNPDALIVGDPARIATPSGGSGNPSSTTTVPSYTNIGCLDSNIYASPPAVSRYGTREIRTKNRVRLTNINYLSYYVIKDFYETTDYDAYFQYSLDNSTWTTIDTLANSTDATIGYNTWSLRKVSVPTAAKSYGGVYLRFYQQSFNNSSGYDGWAFSPVVATEYEDGLEPIYVGIVLNMGIPNSLRLGAPARLTTPSGASGNPSSTTTVPSYTNIGCLDSNIYASPPAPSRNGTREIATRNRIILTGCSTLKYRARKDWFETATYDAYFQYSLDNSTWTTIDTLDRNDSSYTSWGERTVVIPDAAKYYGGVYLRFYQASFNNSAGYDGWAFTSVVALSGGGGSGLTNSDKTSAYTLTSLDKGALINTNSSVTVPSGIFSAGDAITVYNNNNTSPGTDVSIIQGSSVTLRVAGTETTGNLQLVQKGVCTILCVSSNTFVVSGTGIG